MKPTTVFLAVVKAIRGQMTPDPNNANATKDEMLVWVGIPYLPTLKFIWAAITSPDKVTAPTSAPLQDDETTAWEKETAKQQLHK